MNKLVVERRYVQNDQEVGREVYQGEIAMSQEQQDYYKNLIGDGKASVTVSRTLAEKNFGSGGDVFVSVTLTCDQSQQGLDAGIGLAKWFAENKAWEHFGEFKQQLFQRGILKPGQ